METLVSAPVPARPGWGGWYLVAVLTLLATVSYVDRMILNLLVDPVKRSLVLSDTQISLVQGLGFSVAYILANPYLGRLSDRVNRRNLLIGAAVVWSLATAMSALASGFWSLMLCRIAVGAAEAAVQPSSWSMLSDRFPADRLPRMMSLFLVSPYIGGGLALIFGGALVGSSEAIGRAVPALMGMDPWRQVFIIVGLGGIAIAALLLPVREPVRKGAAGTRHDAPPSVRATLGFLYTNRGFFGWFYLAMASIVVLLYAVPAWMPVYASRQFATPIATLGLQFGVMVLIAGSAGVLTGPAIIRALETRGVRGSIMVAVSGIAMALVPCAIAIPFVWSSNAALVLSAMLTVLFSLPQAMGTSALQIVTPPLMRGLSASIYIVVVSITGLGLAPLMVALLTDHLFADPKMVGWSLGTVCSLAAVVASVSAIRAIGPYRALLAAQAMDVANREV